MRTPAPRISLSKAAWLLLLASSAGDVAAQGDRASRAAVMQRAAVIPLERSPDRTPPSAQWTRTERLRPPPDTAVVRQVESLPRSQSVRQYLEHRGVVADRPTVDAFKTLNPQVDSRNRIPANTRVSAFVPEVTSGHSAITPPPVRARVDMANAARYSAALEVDRATRIQDSALQLPSSAYRRPIDLGQHRQLLASVDTTARLVAQRADTLPARDLALSRYYLRNANGVAQKLNMQAASRPLGDQDLQRLAVASQPVQAMQARMASGQPPIAYRQITVHVRGDDGKELRNPLRVYVLPAGLVDDPDDQDLILELLNQLSFDRLTSPSTGTVQDGDMRVWVGPDYQYEAMAKLVMARQVTRYAPVHGHLPGDPSAPGLLFMAPANVTVPPAR